MTSHEQAVLDALRSLEVAAAKGPTGGAPGGVLPILRELDRLTAEMPADSAPDLRHYLQRRSYEKARQWLETRG